MARHTMSPETAKPSSSSKRANGAKHAYLSRNGVVIVSSPPWDEADSIRLEPVPINAPRDDDDYELQTTTSPPWDDEPATV